MAGPAIARPGSTESVRHLEVAAPHSSRTILVISVASCAASAGRPGWCRRCRSRHRGRARAARPISSETGACSSSTRRAATSKPEESKICEPMWLCRPISSRPGGVVDLLHGVEGVAAADREAELLVLVRSGDELVRVRLDADGHAHHHPRDTPELAGDRRQPLDLVEGVDDDPPDPELHRALELGDRLVVAVEADPRHREAGPLGHRELAAGAHVEAEPLLRDPAGDGRAEEGLAGVEDLPPVEPVRKAAARARKSASSSTYAGDPCSATRSVSRRRRPRGRRPTLSAVCDHSSGTSALTSPGSRSHAGPRTGTTAWAHPASCARTTCPTSARARRRRAGRGRWPAPCGVRPQHHRAGSIGATARPPRQHPALVVPRWYTAVCLEVARDPCGSRSSPALRPRAGTGPAPAAGHPPARG